MNKLPSKKELSPVVIEIMQSNGGKLSTSEMNDLVIEKLGITPELLEIEDANCTGSEFSYRMRWVRTQLKKEGIIANPERGIWILV